MIAKAIEMITAQQPEKRNAVWMVGEQLKDICRNEPICAELIVQDLAVKEMSLVEAEKLIAKRAQKNKVGNSGCVTPIEAEEILRKFYGLPDRGVAAPQAPVSSKPTGLNLNLGDFL